MWKILVQDRTLFDLKTSDDQCGGRERKSEHFEKIRFPTFIQNIFHIDPKKHSRIIPYIYERYGI